VKVVLLRTFFQDTPAFSVKETLHKTLPNLGGPRPDDLGGERTTGAFADLREKDFFPKYGPHFPWGSSLKITGMEKDFGFWRPESLAEAEVLVRDIVEDYPGHTVAGFRESSKERIPLRFL
jgi:hypothetical protein